MNKAIVDQTKKNSALDAKLKATRAFQELEKDIATSQQKQPETTATQQEGTATPLKDGQ
jgi:hypothetical protein